MSMAENEKSTKDIQLNRRFLLPFLRLYQDIVKIRPALPAVLLYLVTAQLLFHKLCPFMILFQLPCPACGLTRASLFLLSGQLLQAARINAVSFLWVPFLGYLCICRYFLGKKPPAALPLSCLVCIATLLYYVLRLSA